MHVILNYEFRIKLHYHIYGSFHSSTEQHSDSQMTQNRRVAETTWKVGIFVMQTVITFFSWLFDQQQQTIFIGKIYIIPFGFSTSHSMYSEI